MTLPITPNLSVVQGDDYAASESRSLTLTMPADCPDLTGAAVVLTVKYGSSTRLVAAGAVDGTPGAQTVAVELTDAQTATLIHGSSRYDLSATLPNGHVVTLARGYVTAIGDLTPGTPVLPEAASRVIVVGPSTPPQDGDLLVYEGGLWTPVPVPVAPAVGAHLADTANPHAVTKAQVGLASVPDVDATARAAHTGTQLAATISDLDAAVMDLIGGALVDPYDHWETAGVRDVNTSIVPTNIANMALFYRLPRLLADQTFSAIDAYPWTVQNGNYDIGFYESDGTTLTRLYAKGSTPHPGIMPVKTILPAPITRLAGRTYYAAFASDSTTATWAGWLGATAALGAHGRMVMQKTNAFPLPASVVVADMSGHSRIVWMAGT